MKIPSFCNIKRYLNVVRIAAEIQNSSINNNESTVTLNKQKYNRNESLNPSSNERINHFL